MNIINFCLEPTGNSVKELSFPEPGSRWESVRTAGTEVFSSRLLRTRRFLLTV